MKAAITDANIFMHLIDGDLLESFFKLDLELCTTQEVLIELQEESSHVAPYIDFQLTVINSDEDQMEKITAMECAPGLSLTDRTILYHASEKQCMVLTGEGLMTKECKRLGLDVHGILWIMDELEAKKICSPALLHERLSSLMNFQDFRVPKNLCTERLQKWSNA